MRTIRVFIILFLAGFNFMASQSRELDSLSAAVKLMPEDSLKCETYLRMAYLFYSGDASEMYAHKALDLAKQLNSPGLAGKAFHRLAWSYGLDEMDKKTAYLDSAAASFTKINDAYGLGNVFDTKGTILMIYGSIEESFESYQKAYDYFSSIPDEERKAGVLNNWAIAEYTGGNTQAALEKYQTALEYRLKEVPVSHIDIARLYQGMGECHRLNGNLDLAATNYLKGYEHRSAADNIGVVESMMSIASMIYEAAEKQEDTTSILALLNTYGFQSSQDLIEKSEKTRGVSDRPGLQNEIMDVKRQNYLLKGDFEAAYGLLEKQKEYQEQNKLKESSLEALADMKVRFEKDQLKIELLEEEVMNQKTQERVNMLLFSLVGLLLISLAGFLYFQNRVKSGKLELNEAHREQQIISMRSMLEGQEKERSRIARDLHDGLGNLLSSLKVNFGSLQINFDDKNSERIYGTASEMIDEACSEVRKIAHEMMPQSLRKLGLRKAVEDLVVKMDAVHEFSAELHVHGTERTFDDNTNVMLFRIIQEALNNIVKYAQAHEVSVQMVYGDEWFDLTIEDDGIGFDPHSADVEKGMGLKSIAFRTEFIGGTYDLNSRIGVGTLVTINIPLSEISEV